MAVKRKSRVWTRTEGKHDPIHNPLPFLGDKAIDIWLFDHRYLLVQPNVTASLCPWGYSHIDAVTFGYPWRDDHTEEVTFDPTV